MDIDHIRTRFAPGHTPTVSVDEGWRPLLITLDAALTKADPELRYITVAQKYGRLIVYTTSTNEAARLLIREAEKLASRTCERCGSPTANLCQRGSWLRTLCPSCAAEQHYTAVQRD